jgi:hypothetical protein
MYARYASSVTASEIREGDMKRALLVACCILLSATAVSAENGAFCLFSDASGTECNIVDDGGVVQVYIIHAYTDGAVASQFKLDVSGTGWTHMNDAWNFPMAIGQSINGVSIAYGACLTGPIAVGTINFTGASAPDDTAIRIVPDPAVEYIQVVDCDSRTVFAAGGTAYVNSDLDCVCEPNQTPMLRVDPTSIDIGYIDVTRQLTVINVGGGTLTWGVMESIPWLVVSPTSGTNTTDVTVTVDRLGMSPGMYSGTLNVSSNGGSETILVYITVPPQAPILDVSPGALTFNDGQTDRSLIVSNDGIGDLTWSIASDQSWLSVNPVGGVNSTTVTVHVDRTGLADGTYYGNLSVTSNGGDATVAVTLIVAAPEPILSVSPGSLSFGPYQTEKNITVSNVGTGDLIWTVSGNQSWLSASPFSGTNYALVAVNVDRTGLAPGDYSGALTVTSNGGTATVPVTMTVPDTSPHLVVSPGSFSFGKYLTNLTLDVANAGIDDLIWSITSNQTWLSVNPVSGVNDTAVDVHVDRTGLAPGTYFANLFVTSNGGDATVSATMSVPDPSPQLIVSPGSFVFGEHQTDKILEVANGGIDDLVWSISSDQAWLTVIPVSGVNDTDVDVHVDRTGLAPGTYFANLFVTSNGGDTTVFVTMFVPDPSPQLVVSPGSLVFTQSQGVATLNISNAGTEDLTWSITDDRSWLGATPASGVNNMVVTVSVSRAGLALGDYHANLFVTSNGGDVTVPVTMWVGPHSNLTVYFDHNHTEPGKNCPTAPAGTVLDSLYVVANNFNMWMNAIEYKIEYPLQMMFLGDMFPSDRLTIGSSQAGVGVSWPLPANAFDALLVQKVRILWLCQGCGPEDYNIPIRVLPYPGQPTVRAVRWPDLVVVPAAGMTSLICPLVPVEETTWGDIKSLFR